MGAFHPVGKACPRHAQGSRGAAVTLAPEGDSGSRRCPWGSRRSAGDRPGPGESERPAPDRCASPLPSPRAARRPPLPSPGAGRASRRREAGRWRGARGPGRPRGGGGAVRSAGPARQSGAWARAARPPPRPAAAAAPRPARPARAPAPPRARPCPRRAPGMARAPRRYLAELTAERRPRSGRAREGPPEASGRRQHVRIPR